MLVKNIPNFVITLYISRCHMLLPNQFEDNLCKFIPFFVVLCNNCLWYSPFRMVLGHFFKTMFIKMYTYIFVQINRFLFFFYFKFMPGFHFIHWFSNSNFNFQTLKSYFLLYLLYFHDFVYLQTSNSKTVNQLFK